jgi:hypothetical protein
MRPRGLKRARVPWSRAVALIAGTLEDHQRLCVSASVLKDAPGIHQILFIWHDCSHSEPGMFRSRVFGVMGAIV